ncbi:MAG: WYL domain-containing protein [Ruminococcaceae bacterium]|nr:WYL domain-containing protein [Oscillospiraceae bacterium]
MAKQAGQKIRLLRVLSVLSEFTDEDHSLTCEEILSHLSAYGIEAERKSIYDDIRALGECGFDIRNDRGKGGGYRLLSGQWELSELKMLIDAVGASHFLTEKKSRALIDKIKKLTSRYHADALGRHVHLQHRAKSDNESVFYSVDVIHEAIRCGSTVSFYYLDYLPDGSKVRRHEGKRYTVTPVELMMDDEKYYLIAIAEGSDAYRHYRVDKMEGTCLEKRAERSASVDRTDLDLARYAISTFGMFGGEVQTVRLRAENRMASVLIDRFDKENCTMIPDGGDHFTLAVRVVVSPQFFAWIFGLEGKVQILSPDTVKQQYKAALRQALEE